MCSLHFSKCFCIPTNGVHGSMSSSGCWAVSASLPGVVDGSVAECAPLIPFSAGAEVFWLDEAAESLTRSYALSFTSRLARVCFPSQMLPFGTEGEGLKWAMAQAVAVAVEVREAVVSPASRSPCFVLLLLCCCC